MNKEQAQEIIDTILWTDDNTEPGENFDFDAYGKKIYNSVAILKKELKEEPMDHHGVVIKKKEEGPLLSNYELSLLEAFVYRNERNEDPRMQMDLAYVIDKIKKACQSD